MAVGPKKAISAAICAEGSTRPQSDGDNHHHVGTGSHLPDAIQVDQVREVEPVMHVDGQDLHLREGRHAPADSQDREIREDSNQSRDLVHGVALGFCALRG